MKVSIDSKLVLYPTPIGIIGSRVDGRNIDYERLKPVLFEFQTHSYLRTGSLLGKALSFHKRTESDGISAPEGRNRR